MILECKREATRQELIDRCNYLQKELDTVYAEFDRLETLEDNTAMLKQKLKEKDEIIDMMATVIDNGEEGCIGLVSYCTRLSHLNDNYCSMRNCTDCVIEYFEKQIQNK